MLDHLYMIRVSVERRGGKGKRLTVLVVQCDSEIHEVYVPQLIGESEELGGRCSGHG